MFDSYRAGDVVLFAADNWSFGPWLGAHGSCIARDMHVPLFFAGPGLTGGAAIEHARLVDIMPTILDLLGELQRLSDIDPIDGVSLIDKLLNAGQNP